tara:strand:- start:343 stop:471 length:129 start_codon:yes stop_codon:yes gene_type:complete
MQMGEKERGVRGGVAMAEAWSGAICMVIGEVDTALGRMATGR